MYVIKHNRKKYLLPSKASELSYEGFLKVKKWDGIDEAEFIEILLGIDYDIALELTDGYLKEDCFEFYKKDEYPKPDKILISGKRYKVQDNLFNQSTAGQIATFKQVMQKIKQDEWKEKIHYILPEILAIYFYPKIRDTLFSSIKYNEITYLIKRCSYKDVLGIGFFLLTKYSGYLVLKNKHSVDLMQKQPKPELID